MAQSAWCGFYLAVREPGTIAAGESFTVVPGSREVGIAELFRARTRGPPECWPTATPFTPATTPTCSSTSC